jgi:transposase-like protein
VSGWTSGSISRSGRPRAIDPEKLEAILSALENGASKAAICRNFGVKRTTLYHALHRQEASQNP